MTRALILLALAAAAIAGAVWAGSSWRAARDAADLAEQHQRAQGHLIDAAEALSRREYDLRQALDALTARAMEHEDAARADPDPCRLPGAVSLQRLRARWAAPQPPAD